MTEINAADIHRLLDQVNEACREIEQSLASHLEATTNNQYKSDIEKDLVTLRNLKEIASVVREDIEIEKVGASTELLLRIAANDFRNKLAQIPEKKTLRKEIIKNINEVHRVILRLKIRTSDAGHEPKAVTSPHAHQSHPS